MPSKIVMARAAGRTFDGETGAAGLEPATPGFGDLGYLRSRAGLRLLHPRMHPSRKRDHPPGAESRMRLERQADRRIQELETALEDARAEAREQAYQIQRLYAIGLADVLVGVRRDLEAVPADVERALRRIRELLARVPPAA
jgi:hypothetical protein